MSIKTDTYAITAQTIIKNLAKRNMEGFYCKNSSELLELVLPMLKEGSSIAWGGSETLKETGLLNAIETGNYEAIDRLKAVTPEEKRAVFGKTAMCDYFFMSTNAITFDGELVNIDGNGNRVAALIHGPQQVFIIAGMNKVVTDIAAGMERTRNFAAPPNTVRLSRKTPCSVLGHCGDCLSPDCICNQIVVTRRSGQAGRIKVFLVGEELGY